MNNYEDIDKILKTYRGQLPKPDSTWLWQVRQALTFIITHLFDLQLTAGWMREQCDIIGHNFAGIFKHHAKRKPAKYISHHRIEAAKLLLRDTDHTIINISQELGFSGQAVFTNVFKRLTGETPLGWRKRNE
jgi:AraC-like DNA-binding protein